MSTGNPRGGDDHQAAFRSSVIDLLDRRGVRPSPSSSAVTYDLALWREMCGGLGLADLATAAPESSFSPTELMAICFELLGERLAPVPAMSSFALAVPALRSCGADTDGAVIGSWWPELLAGQVVATVALPAAGALEVSAGSHAPGRPRAFTITGHAPHTVDGATADVVLVLAEIQGAGLCLLHVDSESTDRVDRRPEATFDLSRELAHLTFQGAQARVVGRIDAGEALRRAIATRTTLLLAAEQLGGLSTCVRMSVEHARTRYQFGRSIGSFQAIKHRLSDMHLAVELTRTAVLEACRAVDADAPDAELWATVAYRTASENFTLAAAQALQIHGGLGFTWEHPIHLFLKRARSSQVLLSLPTERTARIAEFLGL